MAIKDLFKKPDINEIVKDDKEVVKTLSSKEQGTQHHKTDMLSDNRLSKNIRPIILIWTYALFTIIVGCIVIFKTEFPPIILNTIFIMLGACVTFYFPGRIIEKYFKSKIK